MPSSRTRTIVLTALLTALLAASAWVTIPIGVVPVTLQIFVLAVIVLVARPAEAAAAVGLYLAMGGFGLPVFSGAQGGLGVIGGPTGGYLVGFWLGVVVASWLRVNAPVSSPIADAVALGFLVTLVYAAGVLWLAWSTGRPVSETFAIGALPFLPVDALKCVAAASVAAVLRRAGLVPAPSGA